MLSFANYTELFSQEALLSFSAIFLIFYRDQVLLSSCVHIFPTFRCQHFLPILVFLPQHKQVELMQFICYNFVIVEVTIFEHNDKLDK